MKTYTIQIDQTQLTLLTDAADFMLFCGLSQGKTFDDVKSLAEMLHSLPSDEDAEPGVIHGLCL